jgi:hypothetical protein
MDNSEIQAPLLSAKTLKSIDLFLEDYYPKASEAGDRIAACKMDKTQVRGLENLIVSVTRFSEVINYIKNQVGKEREKNTWKEVGPILLSQLKDLESQANEIAGDHPLERLEVKLRLLRGWARQVVAHYLYKDREERGQ